MIDIYAEATKYFVFTVEDINKLYHNIYSARSAIGRLIKQGKALKIRENLYTCISMERGGPVADRFQIASRITPTSYVSYHTAMEYYGTADQVYYDVYVSSESRFSDFEFDGYIFHYIKSRMMDGVTSSRFNGGVLVTDKERTVIDCIKESEKISGLEETIENIRLFNHLDENKLLFYMEKYSNQFLYQKTGLILSQFQKKFGLSDYFFEICQAKIGKSKRYLQPGLIHGIYDSKWKLVVPPDYLGIKNGGGADAAV